MSDSKLYDGFYILPNLDDDGLKLRYFDFLDDFDKGDKVAGNSLGDMYHVVLFKPGEDSVPVLDDHFEAIFGDPEAYVQNLLGANLFGCFVKKTENSYKWLDDYLKRVLGCVKMAKYAGAIANN